MNRPATVRVGTADPDDDLAEVLTVDLADPRLYAGDRPERIWATMRRAGRPLRMGGLREHWAVTRYDQVRQAFRLSAHLSSEKGIRLGEKPTDAAAGEAAGGLSMLVADDPGHARMRRALEPAFSAGALRRLAGSTRALARQLVADAAAQSSVDVIDAVVAPLLTATACDLVGVADEDRGRIAQLTETAFSGSGHTTATAQITAHVQLLGYCGELLDTKLRTPGDDVGTLLARALDSGVLTRQAAIMNCHDFVVGGNASARYALTAVPWTLLTQRPFWAGLRAGDTDLRAATEELLRGEAPVNHVMRVALDDIELGGEVVRRGELVTLWLRSANRDPDVFDTPDELRPDRRGPAHLAFGRGAHHCIAAGLGRLEVSALVGALVELVADAEPAGEPRRMESSFLRGYRSLPLALRRR